MKTNDNKRRLRIALPIAILAAGFAVMVLLILNRSRPESQPTQIPLPTVHVTRVDVAPITFTVRAHGTVVPRSESDLIPQTSGPVVWVSPALASGGFFEAEEPLMRIERADYEVTLESRRASVARAEAEYARAQKELARQQKLAKQSVASDAAFDDAVQREKVNDAALREAHAQLAQAERDLDRTEVRAPYAGRVRSTNVGVGQFVNRGSAVATIYAVDQAEVRLPIPDAELRYLDLPMIFRDADPQSAARSAPDVVLRAEFAGRSHEWQGKIVRTEGEIDPKSRMVHVIASVEDPYGRIADPDAAALARPPLAVGLFVEAEIRGRDLAQAVVLPRAALRDGERVVVVDADSRLHYRSVDVVRVERDSVVIDAGLRAGESVLTSVLNAVVEGMAVNVTPPSSAHADADAIEVAP